MALDEALFRSVQAGNSPPVLRLYRWQPATVTLGYGQRGSGQVSLEPAAGGVLLSRLVDWVNRWLDSPSGIEQVAEQLITSFAELLPVAFRDDQSTRKEAALARELEQAKYGSDAWNLKGDA